MASGPSEIPDEPTVTSVLGVKGELRFHPHGSTQKAHVVLRQVELSEDSDDEGDSSMIYFSLFAQKRIEVKPGKEILLAVATPDGKFLETPVVFAGKVSGGDEPARDDPPQPFGSDFAVKMRAPVIPPKLRKPWLEVPIIESPTTKPPRQRTFASVAIQAEPDTDASAKPSASPSAAESTLVSLPDVSGQRGMAGPSSEVSVEEQLESSSNRERSLSPMEIDSRSSTPSHSPPITQCSATNDDRANSKSFSPPGLSVPIPAEQQQPPLQPSPSHASELQPRPPSSSPESDSPPGLSLPPLPFETTSPSSSKVGVHQPSVSPSKEQPISPTRPAAVPVMPQSPFAASKLEKLVIPVKAESTPSPSGQSANSSTAAPYVPKRKTVPNPFVSGGVLTDFVGKTPAGKSASQSTMGSQPATPSITETDSSATLAPSVSVSTKVSPMPSTPPASSPAPSSIRSSPRSPTPGRSPLLSRRNVLSPPSSPASSSKVKMEDVPVVSPKPEPPSPPSISLSQFVIQTHVPPPPRSIPPPPPPPQRGSRFSKLPPMNASGLPMDSRRSVDNGIPIPTQPPPDYKSIAYVAEGPVSNPLGIRPAGTNGWKSDKPLPPQLSTSAPPKSGSKKPVAIGSGWPYTDRPVNGRRGGRRTSFQNGAMPPPPPSAPPTEHMYSNPFVAPSADFNFNASIGPPLAMPSDAGTVSTTATSNGIPNPSTATELSATRESSRGVKRAASPTPPLTDAQRQRTFKWPTSNALHSVKLKGDGDVGIRTIAHSNDGSMFALTCFDRSVRIWGSKTRLELAKLAHNMPLVDVAWMDRDAGVVTLGENGVVSTWTRSATNKWQWAKILDANAAGERRADDSPCCLAFSRDRLAVAYPKSGVKIWLFLKGTWSPQRSINRQNVTSIKFVEDGTGLLGGTADGVLWHCEVPNGTLRAYAFMRTKIATLDIDPKGTHALAAQSASCILCDITEEGTKGSGIRQAYSVEDPEVQGAASYGFGALFATRGASLLFGSVQGCIMVWDRASGSIVHGLNLGEEQTIQAVASFDGGTALDGHVLTGTREGLLTWFPQPPVEGTGKPKGTW